MSKLMASMAGDGFAPDARARRMAGCCQWREEGTAGTEEESVKDAALSLRSRKQMGTSGVSSRVVVEGDETP